MSNEEWAWSRGGGGSAAKPRDVSRLHPGEKRKLRKAVIAEKRAERAAGNGKGDGLDLAAVYERMAAVNDADGDGSGDVGGDGAATAGPITLPPVNTHGRKLVRRLADALRFSVDEAGSGDARALTLTKLVGADGAPALPDPQQVAAAEATVSAWVAALRGRATGELYDLNAARKEAERRGKRHRRRAAKEAAGDALGDGGSGRRRSGGGGGGSGGAPAAAAAGASSSAAITAAAAAGDDNDTPPSQPRRATKDLVTMTFVKAGAAAVAAAAGDRDGSDASSDAREGDRPPAAPRTEHDEDDEDDDENDGSDSSATSDDDSSDTDSEHSGGEEDDSDLDSGTHRGLGAAMAALSLVQPTPPPPPPPSTSVADAVPAPHLRGEWEAHTSGFGSKLLAKFGYAGGQLGSAAQRRVAESITAASTASPPAASSDAHATPPVVAAMPAPFEAEQRRTRLGLGADY